LHHAFTTLKQAVLDGELDDAIAQASAKSLNGILTIAYFDKLGLLSLMTSTSRTARGGPVCRVVWQGYLL